MAIAQSELGYMTEDEYIRREEAAETRSEYLNGRVYAMFGASKPHNQIAFNLVAELKPQLKSRKCRGYANDMRTKAPFAGLYTDPDIVIVCGDRKLDKRLGTNLLNPTAIIEVLSPSTKSYDRGDKFAYYRTIESFREYVLVAQDKKRIERFIRTETRFWKYEVIEADDATIDLETIGCRLTVANVYDDVDLPIEPLPAGHDSNEQSTGSDVDPMT